MMPLMHNQRVEIRVGGQKIKGKVFSKWKTPFGWRYVIEYEVREMDGYVYKERKTRMWWRVIV